MKFALFDAAAVIAFVAIGRDTHEEGVTFSGVLTTALPFLIGMAAGWAVTRSWRTPTSLRSGVAVAFATVVLGMLLRRYVFGAGTAVTFIFVASAFLMSMMLGWRIVAMVVERRRAPVRG